MREREGGEVKSPRGDCVPKRDQIQKHFLGGTFQRFLYCHNNLWEHLNSQLPKVLWETFIKVKLNCLRQLNEGVPHTLTIYLLLVDCITSLQSNIINLGSIQKSFCNLSLEVRRWIVFTTLWNCNLPKKILAFLFNHITCISPKKHGK